MSLDLSSYFKDGINEVIKNPEQYGLMKKNKKVSQELYDELDVIACICADGAYSKDLNKKGIQNLCKFNYKKLRNVLKRIK